MSRQHEERGPTQIEEAGAEPLLHDDRSHDAPRWLRIVLMGAAVLAAAAVAFLLVDLPRRPPLLPALVARHLGESGVSNPVTGVLLNFRAYDTLLEVTVLVAAVIAVWSLDRGTPPLARDLSDRSEDPVLHELARLVVPLSGVFAVYLTWAGSHTAGGGFQAGALMAGAGVLIAVGGYIPPFSAASGRVRLMVAPAILAILAVGVASLPMTGALLEYPEGWAHGLILGMEGMIAIAVTVALIELFVDVPAVPASDRSLERVHATGDPLGRMLTRANGREAES